MILWSALLTALVGWVLAGLGGYGLILGGIVGAIAGWGGRRAIRAEIADATAPLQAQIDLLTTRLHERRDAGPAPEPVVAPAPDVPIEPEPARVAAFDPAVWSVAPGTPAPAVAAPAVAIPLEPAEPGVA